MNLLEENVEKVIPIEVEAMLEILAESIESIHTDNNYYVLLLFRVV